MRIFGLSLFVGVMVAVASSGCATGGAADDVDPSVDSGSKLDSGSPVQDSATPPKKDSGAPTQDSGNPVADSGGGNCGGQCSGAKSSCCTNTCVDETSDPNNCGSCGNSCGTQSCCGSTCIDTMGSDDANCGGCGVACTNGTCTNGTCQPNNTNCTIDKGLCKHSPCTTGTALNQVCDITDEGIVAAVCIARAACCSTTWDSKCVAIAATLESNSCVGGGC